MSSRYVFGSGVMTTGDGVLAKNNVKRMTNA